MEAEMEPRSIENQNLQEEVKDYRSWIEKGVWGCLRRGPGALLEGLGGVPGPSWAVLGRYWDDFLRSRNSD